MPSSHTLAGTIAPWPRKKSCNRTMPSKESQENASVTFRIVWVLVPKTVPLSVMWVARLGSQGERLRVPTETSPSDSVQ